MAVTRNDPRATATPAPPLVGTIHEGIPVRDLDAAMKFYVDVLGLQTLPRPKLPVPGAWLGRPEGGPQIHLIVGTDYVPGPDARMSPTGRHTRRCLWQKYSSCTGSAGKSRSSWRASRAERADRERTTFHSSGYAVPSIRFRKAVSSESERGAYQWRK